LAVGSRLLGWGFGGWFTPFGDFGTETITPKRRPSNVPWEDGVLDVPYFVLDQEAMFANLSVTNS